MPACEVVVTVRRPSAPMTVALRLAEVTPTLGRPLLLARDAEKAPAKDDGDGNVVTGAEVLLGSGTGLE